MLLQIPGKVVAVALWVAVVCDVFEPLTEEFFVGLRCDGQTALVQPCGGSSERVEEHAAVLIEAFLRYV